LGGLQERISADPSASNGAGDGLATHWQMRRADYVTVIGDLVDICSLSAIRLETDAEPMPTDGTAGICVAQIESKCSKPGYSGRTDARRI
jgi:hypothetical protein